MKKLKRNNVFLLLALSVIFSNRLIAQEDTVAPKEIVKLHYYNRNNSLQYLEVESLLKKGKKTEPRANKAYKLFLDKEQPDNLISTVLTGPNGKAKAIIPPQLKNDWDSAAQHTFLVVTEATGKEEETTSEFVITKAKISLDTSSEEGVKNISVTVMKFENNSWVPV